MNTVKNAWINAFVQKYRSGISHTFVLHHNVSDYVDHSNCLRTYLTRIFADCDLVLVYEKANGITFPLEAHRERFEALTGEPETDPNPINALLKGNGNPKEVVPALGKIDNVLRKVRTALILDHAETIFPASDFAMMNENDRRVLVTLLEWAGDRQIASLGGPIMLLTHNLSDLHPALRTPTRKIEAITVPYPVLDERLTFIATLLNEHDGVLTLDEGMDARNLANATAGLNKIMIEDIVLRALSEGKTLTQRHVQDRKEDIIRSEFSDVLEIVEPEYGFEAIGGLEYAKRFIQSSIIDPMRSGDHNRCPMGVLMTGPAGTGKTAIAEATAKEAGINFVNLNLARILGMYVGSSERNLEKALLAIENLAPTIVLIDEIDQTVQRGGQGDSGVGNRIFKRLLEFMSNTNHRGKVVFLAATNRPDLMDPAMKRAGRFDKKIPFFPPQTRQERKMIFQALLLKYGIRHEIKDFTTATDETPGYTGADLEAVVIKAVEIAWEQQREILTENELTMASRMILPSSQADMEFMIEVALRECNDLTLVPLGFLERVKNMKRNQEFETSKYNWWNNE